MITFAKFQQEVFAIAAHRMLNGVMQMITSCTHPLDDNKMITFCQIWQRDIFHYFVSILHVIHLQIVAYAENAHNVACPVLGKTFKFKIRISDFGTVA